MLIAPLRPRQWLDRPSRLKLGIVEVTVVLGLLDLLFLVFAVVQLPYLFGGVVQVARLGYSEYARRGFFELVWVAGLTLPAAAVGALAGTRQRARRTAHLSAAGFRTGVPAVRRDGLGDPADAALRRRARG